MPHTSDITWRLTSSEVATLAGVKRPVVTTWARRHHDFPRPVTHENGRPIYDGHAVADWLLGDEAEGRKPRGNANPEHVRAELALYSLSSWTREVPAGVLVDGLTSLICLRQQYDRPAAAASWDTVLRLAAELDEDNQFLLAELQAVPPNLGLELAALADELTDAAYNPAEAFEWVLESRRRIGADGLAPDEPAPVLTRTIASIAGIGMLPAGSAVAAPRARSGDLLAALHAAAGPDSGHTYLAAETDPALARLVRRRMLTRDVLEFQLSVTDGDELDEEFGDPDLLVGVLPYESAETRDPEEVLAQVQDWADLLGEHRTALVVGPADALTGPLPPLGRADTLRRSFLANGLLKAAISLPGGAFPYRPAYRAAAWLLARTPKDDREGRVFLADLSAQPLEGRILDDLAEDVRIWRASHWFDKTHEARHAVVVAATDLDDHPGTAFSPQHRSESNRYSRNVLERPARVSELEVALESKQEELLRAHGLSTSLRTYAQARPEDQAVARTTVRHLETARRLRRLPGHRIAAEHLTRDGHYRVIGPEELTGERRLGSRGIERDLLFKAYGHAELTEPGDIVFTERPRFACLVDDEGLSVAVFPAKVLRPRPDTGRPHLPDRPVQPHVLAALLEAAAAEHPKAPGAVRAAVRVEDLQIPDLDPDEEARYETLLADIAHRRAMLSEQLHLLEDLSRLTAAGLNDGTLAIGPGPGGR